MTAVPPEGSPTADRCRQSGSQSWNFRGVMGRPIHCFCLKSLMCARVCACARVVAAPQLLAGKSPDPCPEGPLAPVPQIALNLEPLGPCTVLKLSFLLLPGRSCSAPQQNLVSVAWLRQPAPRHHPCESRSGTWMSAVPQHWVRIEDPFPRVSPHAAIGKLGPDPRNCSRGAICGEASKQNVPHQKLGLRGAGTEAWAMSEFNKLPCLSCRPSCASAQRLWV
jgi:hypothetical protein